MSFPIELIQFFLKKIAKLIHSWSPYVFQGVHDGLDFSANGDEGYSFGIFSVKFSTDGRELVAGSSDDSIYVYDIEQNKLSLQISAHAVCSQFEYHPHVICIILA